MKEREDSGINSSDLEKLNKTGESQNKLGIGVRGVLAPCTIAGDVNFENKVDASQDQEFILRFTAGLIDHFPAGSMLSDEELVDKTEAQASRYFWDRALSNGFVRDTEFSQDASIAATGLGLASLAIMAERSGENLNWVITHAQSEERARLVLDSALSYQSQQVTNSLDFGKAGFLYHFIDANGERARASEVSTVDMALFLSGALTAGQYFGGDIQIKANELFNNVNWQYFLDPTNDRFYHAWKSACSPGFDVSASDGDGCLSEGQWDRPTDEILLINLLALAKDPENEAFKRSLYAWPRVARSYSSYDLVNSYFGSLFTYVYAQAFFDFKNMGFDNPAGVGSTVKAVNWLENAWKALCANRQFEIDQATDHPGAYLAYDRDQWGLSAAYRPDDGTYFGDMGAAPVEVDGGNPRHDGTIPAYGAISTFPILGKRPCKGEPEGSNHPMDALRNYFEKHLDGLWGKYGPKDSFKTEIVDSLPVTAYSSVYLGINIGIEAIMIENYRSSLVNDLFMSHPQIIRAVKSQFPDVGSETVSAFR